jgi:beta-glucosidase-like glycosyl hydrolase
VRRSALLLGALTGALALAPAGCSSSSTGQASRTAPASTSVAAPSTSSGSSSTGGSPSPTSSTPATPATQGTTSSPRTSASARPAPTASTPRPSTAAPTPSADPPLTSPVPAAVRAAYLRMTPAQRAGQLFMAGTPATTSSAAVLGVIRRQHVGSVILTGRSHASVSATRAVTRRLQAAATAAATASVPLVVAVDQEGGNVQVLQGPGFSRMPTALTQGGWGAVPLKASARTWGQQLAAAGVNLNLAPVMDTVPSAAAAGTNAPIGFYRREFGYTPSTVATHGSAFLTGMASAGVATAVKHFPGLGRVRGNTDTTAGVTDTVTTSTDPYLRPFAAGVRAGAPFLMPSSAYYSRIDARHPAAFSPTVLQGLVRGQLGFTGVVLSDDLGSARQVARWTPGQRATMFLDAGGDMVLTVDPSLVPAMVQAVTARMASSPAFARKVDTAALRVLTVKHRMGLLR